MFNSTPRPPCAPATPPDTEQLMPSQSTDSPLREPAREGSVLDTRHCTGVKAKLTGQIATLHVRPDCVILGRDECSPGPGVRAVGVIQGGSQRQLSSSEGTSDRPRGRL